MTAAEADPSNKDDGGGGVDITTTDHNDNDNNIDEMLEYLMIYPSLTIPIRTGSGSNGTDDGDDTNTAKFIEIFPEELGDIPSSTLLQILKDEDADLDVWANVGLAYMQQQKVQESSAILQAACDRPGGSRPSRVRLLASAGIAHLATTNHQGGSSSSSSGSAAAAAAAAGAANSEADQRFTAASKVDTFFPMTWMGKGMYNFRAERLDQARFFFDTTLKQCGPVLPALLGMASVSFREKDYRSAQDYYGKAIRLYPQRGGPSIRVGFGLACYKLGQVDRAKAAFARALQLDPEHVPAMVGQALLDLQSLDVIQPDFQMRREKAIKQMSMANLLDHSNAMVQNHLANHYFWKWTPVPGTVRVEKGSKTVVTSQPTPLDAGERIKIGMGVDSLETVVDEEGDETTTFHMREAWKGESQAGLKIWKKDYDRVMSLAKGAYNSTKVPEIQAESLFLLGRVHHVRDDIENAYNLYNRACTLAPNLSPARFGLAQTLMHQEEYDQAIASLKLVLGTSPTATDALAALGILEVKVAYSGRSSSSSSGNKSSSSSLSTVETGLSQLKKALHLDPLNPDLVLLEAVALQQSRGTYPQSLEKYRRAAELLQTQGKPVPFSLYANIGVLSHETQNYDESLKMYHKALQVLSPNAGKATMDSKGIEGGYVRNEANSLFFEYLDTGSTTEKPSANDGGGSSPTIVVKGGNVSVYSKGDHIRIGKDFTTEIVEDPVPQGEDAVTLKLKKPFVVTPPSPPPQDENAVPTAETAPQEKTGPFPVAVKRENHYLSNAPQAAISIAFNIARVHEAAGSTMAAVELHKAIVKRVPAYVNSYLRLACIARDNGSLRECSAWLKIALQVAPGNPEVLTLVGNLHLSLCDWSPAQGVFSQLINSKVESVEAYSNLSIGNIYFANLRTPNKYAKHLEYAAGCYRQVLKKDSDNAYAANGIGTVLAEMGELFKAKDIFNRVREVSGDTIADAHLNLGHIYLAQKKHAEALQMYQSYMKMTEDGRAPMTTKSREEDMAEVLLYIAFAYFDWARLTELFNNAQAAPADERYKKCVENLQGALKKSKKKEVVIMYNICMTKLQAANCVLQKLSRNIRRTAQEVQDALDGLEESLPKVQEILKWKEEGKKVQITTSMLQDFVTHCQANIESAKQHLEEERRREADAQEIRELQKQDALLREKEEKLKQAQHAEEEAKEQERRDRRAEEKMRKVQQLRTDWEHERAAKEEAASAANKKGSKKGKGKNAAPDAADDLVVEQEATAPRAPPVGETTADLFDDSDDDDQDEIADSKPAAKPSIGDDDDAMDEDKDEDAAPAAAPAKTTEQDLFGGSSSESEEELLPAGAGKKRDADEADGADDGDSKRRKVLSDEDNLLE